MKITMELTMSEVKEMINNGGEAVPVDQEAVDINTKLAFDVEELKGYLKTSTDEIKRLEMIAFNHNDEAYKDLWFDAQPGIVQDQEDLKTAAKEIIKLRSIIEGLESVTPKVEVYTPQTYGDPVGVIDGLPVYKNNGRYACWHGPDYDDKYRADDMKLLATLVKEIKR